MANDFKDGWFTETGGLHTEEVNLSLRMKNIVHHKKSNFQDILVFDKFVSSFGLLTNSNQFFCWICSDKLGKCLVLDDAIQLSELDEFAYQEMIAFLPLNIHPNPKRVLIIGGGDGGVAREVAKHPLVEEIVQCEIDKEVIEVCKKYLPSMTVGFESAKLTLNIGDGYKYVLEHKNEFDVIITDSSDPQGPAVVLFEQDFYQALFEALKPGGIISCQAETFWYDSDFILKIFKRVKSIFPSVSYASTMVATYPAGQIGFLIASKDSNVKFDEPKTQFTEQECDKLKLRYYSTAMHRASFVLPRFFQKQLSQI